MKNKNFFRSCPLFDKMNDEELASVLISAVLNEHSYKQGAFVITQGSTIRHIGIASSGSLQIVSHDFYGNHNILSNINKGELFGEVFAFAGCQSSPVSVVAKTDATVIDFNYKKVLTDCPNKAAITKLVANMLRITAQKTLILNEKIQHLSQRTTREKLLSYFSSMSEKQNSSTFTIPFNRQELADYLCVDRSAMSTALSKMKSEGILQFQRNTFTLL